MNTDLIKKTSRAKYLHSLAKISTKENHESLLLITLSGGIFRASPELIGFLSVENMGDVVVLLDIYENPISVNRLELLSLCISTYKLAMNSWFDTVEKINSQR